MNEETLNKIKQFESLIIKCLLNKYGKNLPQDKVELLNSSNFITEEVIKNSSSDAELRGNIIRNVVKNVIDVTCEKSLLVDNVEIIIPYGDYLEVGLIEYYSQELAETYGIDINKIEGLENNVEMIKQIKEKLDNGLDSMVFKSDAIKILGACEIKELIDKNDNLAIEEYIKNKESIINASGELDQKQLDTINQELSDKTRIQIVYLNGKQHIKYIDLNDQVHLIESKDPALISKAYKETIVNGSVTIDVDKLFENLNAINNEINLTTIDQKDLDSVTSEEIDMLDFIHSNTKIVEKAKNDKITHSEDNTIHVIEATNEIVTTTKYEDEDSVKSKLIKNDVTGLNMNGSHEYSQEVIDNDERIISEEEANRLTEKYKNNEKLTLEELRALRNYEKRRIELNQQSEMTLEEIIEMQKEELKELKSVESGPRLVPKYYGFVRTYLTSYIIIMTISIGLIVGMLLFKLTN